MKDTYLTVDLDYWFDTRDDGFPFIKELYELRRPITVFTQHQLVLKDITKQYRKVINVDYHADLCESGQNWPNCGTWGNRVFGRHEAEFVWIYPCRYSCIERGHGLCHTSHEEESENNPFLHPELTTWAAISRDEGYEDIDLDRVDRVSLILSIDWSRPHIIEPVLRYIKNREGDRIQFYGKNVIKQINEMLDIV